MSFQKTVEQLSANTFSYLLVETHEKKHVKYTSITLPFQGQYAYNICNEQKNLFTNISFRLPLNLP